MNPLLVIDGSTLEGGGQILRNSLSLSTLFRTPLRIHSIRAGRKVPGLGLQHVTGIELLGSICEAKMEGVKERGEEIDFTPGKVREGKEWVADIKSAGSTSLLLQISLPVLLFSSGTPSPHSHLTLLGGTNASHAPQFEYLTHLLFPLLNRHFSGFPLINASLLKRGYYPRGGGKVIVEIPSIKGPLGPLTLVERGDIIKLEIIVNTGGFESEEVVDEIVSQTKTSLLSNPLFSSLPASALSIFSTNTPQTWGHGASLLLFAHTPLTTLGSSSLLTLKRKFLLPSDVFPEIPSLVNESVSSLTTTLETKGICLDEYAQDQVIVFMALAKGESRIRIGELTLHTKTAIWVAEKLTKGKARFEVEEVERGVWEVRCWGVGFVKEDVEGEEEG